MEQPLQKINLDDIFLSGVFFVDKDYSRKHTHLLHKHQGILELLYVAQGEGRYTVGNREYAVHAGDLVICKFTVKLLFRSIPFKHTAAHCPASI